MNFVILLDGLVVFIVFGGIVFVMLLCCGWCDCVVVVCVVGVIGDFCFDVDGVCVELVV